MVRFLIDLKGYADGMDVGYESKSGLRVKPEVLTEKDGISIYRDGERASGEQGWTALLSSVLDVPGA